MVLTYRFSMYVYIVVYLASWWCWCIGYMYVWLNSASVAADESLHAESTQQTEGAWPVRQEHWPADCHLGKRQGDCFINTPDFASGITRQSCMHAVCPNSGSRVCAEGTKHGDVWRPEGGDCMGGVIWQGDGKSRSRPAIDGLKSSEHLKVFCMKYVEQYNFEKIVILPTCLWFLWCPDTYLIENAFSAFTFALCYENFPRSAYSQQQQREACDRQTDRRTGGRTDGQIPRLIS